MNIKIKKRTLAAAAALTALLAVLPQPQAHAAASADAANTENLSGPTSGGIARAVSFGIIPAVAKAAYERTQLITEIVEPGTPLGAAEAASVFDNDAAAWEQAEEVYALLNAEREKRELPALSGNRALYDAAMVRVKELDARFSHERPDGRSFATVLDEFGITCNTTIAENAAYGQKSPAEAVDNWMNSDGHRKNILRKNISKVGVGVYANTSGRLYWLLLFTD